LLDCWCFCSSELVRRYQA